MNGNNPMLEKLPAVASNSLSPIKKLMNTVKMAGNPQFALQQMMSQNPQLKQAMDLVQQNGGDAKTTFYNLAKEKGVDPNTILEQLK